MGINGNATSPAGVATHQPTPRTPVVAKAADASLLDSLWVYDHLLYEGGYAGHPDPEPVMECFTILGAIAAKINDPAQAARFGDLTPDQRVDALLREARDWLEQWP